MESHPELHRTAELDRNWVWLPVDLRGDDNKPTREALKEFGFRFAKRGHALPSGATGTWAHCCEVPMRFTRKGGSKSPKRDDDTKRADPLDYQSRHTISFNEADLMAAI